MTGAKSDWKTVEDFSHIYPTVSHIYPTSDRHFGRKILLRLYAARDILSFNI